MTLAPGTRFGPYEIQQQIGEGGMGSVYRALDTRLNRLVAIKMLAAHCGDRFRQEGSRSRRSATRTSASSTTSGPTTW